MVSKQRRFVKIFNGVFGRYIKLEEVCFTLNAPNALK